ncbi:head GIN domain-containing protein [Georgenia sp. SYP-B2076]|uniref:head GIN domain-containing protein n=1 Tax=Georgenia sp. SYP-B2076 TaxID=2495881 RepID=UPI000F8E9529|nr:head GIN domain-containing protein [Georgenia sp. SYP-B2076]
MALARIPALLTLAAVTATLAACGSIADVGPTASEERDIADVTAVQLSTSGRLTISTGGEPSLTVTAGRNVLDRLTSEVRDGVLVLGAERGMRGTLGDVSYELVLPEVEALTVEGSGDVDADLVATDGLSVTVNGSGDATVRGVDVADLDVTVAGSGTVDAAGTAGRQSVRIDGSGEYDGADLASTDAEVSVDGSGDAAVQASGALDASVSGSGSIVHSGGASVRSAVKGSGDISQR